MRDLERAKELLQNSSHNCVLCKDETTYTSDRTGIAPMMEFLDAGTDLCGFSAADRIVGKAAAMLFVLAGVREVYAEVLGESALPVFERYGIAVSWGTIIPYIVNRRGDGPCPMEHAVRNIEEPTVAREAIRDALDRLRQPH